ncbi:MAG: hypothetical protein K2P94_15260 [Rhodospirillaceae bacterium]|nr:hypothetical protein [Rhodospirillaceae bacterium]
MSELFAFIFAIALGLTAPAAAHEEFRVVGEITQSKSALIEVKMRDGKTAAVHIDGQTKITRDKAGADAEELKAGQFVVIDAYGDDFTDLLALEIRLVPPIAPAK